MTPTTDPIRRAVRVAMACIAVAIPAIPALAAAFNVPAGRVTQITAVFSFVLVLFTGARNHLEDNTAFPAVLKAPPSSGENPVPEPTPPEPDPIDPIPSRPIKKVRKARR